MGHVSATECALLRFTKLRINIFDMSEAFNVSPLVLALITLWTLPWKGVALWRAVQRRDQWWFIAILVLNTLAVLEILYIFIWNKRPKKGESIGSQKPA
jgi:hypothetical protein